MMVCACCGFDFLSGAVRVRSLLLGASSDMRLCVVCANKEEDAIEKADTNDLPDLLATYKYPIRQEGSCYDE